MCGLWIWLLRIVNGNPLDRGFSFICRVPVAMNHFQLGPSELFKGKIQNKTKHIMTGVCLFFPVNWFSSLQSSQLYICDVYQRFVTFLWSVLIKFTSEPFKWLSNNTYRMKTTIISTCISDIPNLIFFSRERISTYFY